MHDRVIFHKYFGPFGATTFALLQDNGDSFRLSFDTGPEFEVTKIFSGEYTVFKFLPGTIGEIRVTHYFGKKLSFEGRQIPTFSLAKSAATELTWEDELEPVCSSIHCAESLPCPDPSKPILVCPGDPPNPMCSAGEG